MPLIRHVVLDLTIAAFLFTATGCLVGTSNKVQESGTAVGDSTLRQVEIGKTTESWLIATLGPPSTRAKVSDQPGVEVFSYNHKVVRNSKGHIFLLYAGSNQKLESSRTFFELHDGVVAKYWSES